MEYVNTTEVNHPKKKCCTFSSSERQPWAWSADTWLS